VRVAPNTGSPIAAESIRMVRFPLAVTTQPLQQRAQLGQATNVGPTAR